MTFHRLHKSALISKIPLIMVSLFLCTMAFLPTANAQTQQQLFPFQAPRELSDTQRAIRQASILEQQGHLEEAAQIYRRLYEDNSNERTIYERYRDILIRMGDYGMAEYLITTWLKNIPDDIPSLVRLGTIYYHQNDKEKALRQWQSILEVIGKRPGVYQQIISTMIENGLFQEAADLIDEARESLEQPAYFALQMASLYLTRMNYQDAADEYVLYYLHRSNRDVNFLVSQLSRFPDEQDVYTQVIQVLNQTIEEYPGDTNLQKVLADYLYRIREYNEAIAQYRKLEDLENAPGEYQRRVADQLLSDGEYDYAMQVFQSLINQAARPQPELELGYAEAGYRQLIDRYSRDTLDLPFQHNMFWETRFVVIPREAESHLSDIVTNYQEVNNLVPNTLEGMLARYRLGDLYLRVGNDFDRALEYFSKAADNPDHPRWNDALIQTGFCYLAKGDLHAARDYWENALTEISPNAVNIRNELLLYLASTYFYEGDIKQGIQQLHAAQDSTNISSELYNDILEVQNFVATALQNQSASDTTTLRQFFQAEFYLQQHKITEAQNAHLEILNMDPGSPIASYMLLRVSQLGLLLQQNSQVMNWLTQLTQNYPDSKLRVQAIYLLGSLNEEQGRYEAAIQWYEQILEEYPASLLEEKARQSIRKLQTKMS